MNKSAILAVGTVMAFMLVGCSSLHQDHLRASLDAKIVPAKFKPTVVVMKDKGIVSGYADSKSIFWIIPCKTPNKFSSNPNSGGVSIFEDQLKAAAIYDACQKCGADIILAPRFTERRFASFLWFYKERAITVEGIPAKITGAEEIPIEDWPILFGTASGTQLIKNSK